MFITEAVAPVVWTIDTAVNGRKNYRRIAWSIKDGHDWISDGIAGWWAAIGTARLLIDAKKTMGAIRSNPPIPGSQRSRKVFGRSRHIVFQWRNCAKECLYR